MDIDPVTTIFFLAVFVLSPLFTFWIGAPAFGRARSRGATWFLVTYFGLLVVNYFIVFWLIARGATEAHPFVILHQSFGCLLIPLGPVVVVIVFVLQRRALARHDDLVIRRQICQECGYSLVGCPSDRCPECGAAIMFDYDELSQLEAHE